VTANAVTESGKTMTLSLYSIGQTGNRLAKPSSKKQDASIARVGAGEWSGRKRPGLLARKETLTTFIILMFLGKGLALGEDAMPQIALDFGSEKDIGAWVLNPKEIKTVKSPAGKALLIGSDGNTTCSVKLDMNKASNLKTGTICFWVSPDDWAGSDTDFHHFFEAGGANARAIIYKHANSKDLFFLFGPEQKAGEQAMWTVAKTDISGWMEKSWHHVSCTWDEKELKIYINGELQASARIKEQPGSAFSEFQLGPMAGKWTHINGKSLLENFVFYNSPRSSSDIYKEYLKKAYVHADGGLTLVSVAKAVKPPRLDGDIKQWEYTFAGSGFLDIQKGVFSAYQSRFLLSYDDENLYFGIISPAQDKMLANIQDRDGCVWLDDSVEIFLAPAGIQDRYHFIFNSIGTFYDEISPGRKEAYNSKLQIANKIGGGLWTLEVKMPFKFLGGKAPSAGDTWKFNICRSYPSLNKYTSVTRVRGVYDNLDDFSMLGFEEDNCASFAINSFGDLDKGVLNIQPEINSPVPGKPLVFKCRLSSPQGLIFDQNENVEVKEKGTQSVSFSRKNIKGKASLDISMLSDKIIKYKQNIPLSTENTIKLNSLYTSPDKTKLVFCFEQSHVSIEGKTFKGYINIIGQDGRKLAGHEFVPGNLAYNETADISALPIGSYIIETVFTDQDGNKIFDERRNYWIMSKEPEWRNNLIGVSKEVPPPWEPLSRNGNIIKCWGRSYSFEKSFMPSMIESQNVKLFSGPALLKGKINGRDVEEKNCSIKWGNVNPDKASLTTESFLGTARVLSKIDMEYDGFFWVNVNITPEKDDKIEQLFIELPLSKDNTTLVNSFDYRLNGTGALDGYWSKNLKTKPIFWVGSEKAGFQWFAENLSGWRLDNPQKGVEIIPNGKSLIVRLNIVDCPTEEKIELAFGLQATPVKSRMPKWRTWRILEDDKIKDPRENLSLWNIAFQWYNYPDLNKMVKGTVEKLEALRIKGVKVCPYVALQAASSITPEFMYYGEEWLKQPQTRTPIPTIEVCAQLDHEYRELLSLVCPTSSQYRDFFLWKLKGVLDKINFDGLYFDWAQVVPCNNALHGCRLWKDHENGSQMSLNIIGSRELAKRIYTLAKTKNPEAIIVHHASGEIAIPVQSFCDIMVDGENFNGLDLVKEKNYFNFLPLDKFRAEYMSQPWGPVAVFLPEFGINCLSFDKSADKYSFWKTPEAQRGVRHLLGMILVHDSLCWPSWGSGFNWMLPSNPMRGIWKIQDDFGWGDELTFYPYWDNSKIIVFGGSVPKEMVLSFYRKNNGNKLLLIPFNNSDNDVSTDVKINFDKLGVKPPAKISAVDKNDNSPVPSTDNSLRLNVKARDFKLISIAW